MNTSADHDVVLITGAGSGIGAASARSFAEAGAAVAVTDLNYEAADAVARDILSGGGVALPVHLDVSDEDAWRSAMSTVHLELGAVTVLHSNAGANSGAVMNRDLDVVSMDVDIWDTMMSVVLRGSMLSCKYVLPDMVDQQNGCVIFTSSIKGQVGSSLRTAYSTAKAGLAQLTRSVATQYGRHGIRCNAVAPGIIDTPGLREVVGDDYYAALRSAHLLPRTGNTADIVNAVRFLASEQGAYITGQTLVVDGGLSGYVPVLSPDVQHHGSGGRPPGTRR